MNRHGKLLFIINKYSGTSYQPAIEAAIRTACAENQVEGHTEFTQHAGHASVLAAAAVADGYETVVAVGGDGTVNEVASSLVHTSTTMGIIPKGSGNGLARHLAIPMDVYAALKCLFKAKAIPMDTFHINGKLSLNVSGIGFDGRVANLFGSNKKRGLRGYAALILNEFRRFAEFEAHIRTEQREFVRKAFVIAMANSSQYGNNAKIAPAASICDGLIDVSILKKIAPYRLDLLYQFFSGTIDQSGCCEVIPARQVTIQLSSPMFFHVDGEPGGEANRFEIEMMPASLQMLVPAAFTDGKATRW